jgi:hypothetical protein
MRVSNWLYHSLTNRTAGKQNHIMTIKELIEKLNNFPDDYVVKYTYDGPDTLRYIDVSHVLASKPEKTVYLDNLELMKN